MESNVEPYKSLNKRLADFFASRESDAPLTQDEREYVEHALSLLRENDRPIGYVESRQSASIADGRPLKRMALDSSMIKKKTKRVSFADYVAPEAEQPTIWNRLMTPIAHVRQVCASIRQALASKAREEQVLEEIHLSDGPAEDPGFVVMFTGLIFQSWKSGREYERARQQSSDQVFASKALENPELPPAASIYDIFPPVRVSSRRFAEGLTEARESTKEKSVTLTAKSILNLTEKDRAASKPETAKEEQAVEPKKENDTSGKAMPPVIQEISETKNMNVSGDAALIEKPISSGIEDVKRKPVAVHIFCRTSAGSAKGTAAQSIF